MSDGQQATPQRKTDAELIDYLRKHLWGVQEAIHRFGEVMQQTATRRAGPFERMKTIMPFAFAELIEAPRDSRLALLYRAVSWYVTEMEATGAERVAAWEAVQAAQTQDFYNALQSSPEVTEEMIAYWFGEPGATDVLAAWTADGIGVGEEGEQRVIDLAPHGLPTNVEGVAPTTRTFDAVLDVRVVIDYNGLTRFYDNRTDDEIGAALRFEHPKLSDGIGLPTTPGHLIVIGEDDKGEFVEQRRPAFLVSEVRILTDRAR